MSSKVARLVRIPADSVHVEGMLAVPDSAHGIVLFVHGSGSSRHSPRNNYVAQVLQECGIGTLLMDLLTPEEDTDYQTRFDIPLLTRRLLAATRWAQAEFKLKTPQKTCLSAISARVPELQQHCRPPRSLALRSARSFPVAAARIWQGKLIWRK